jgi:ribose transport system ATP-binding protein
MLQLSGITKKFPGVLALDNVSLSISAGEVVSVIGENGAGKSTLMKVLGGVYIPDAGSLVWEGQPLTLRSPSDSLAKGIRIIYQELSVLDNLDIAGNIFLGREPRNKIGLLDTAKMQTDTAKILERLGLKRAPNFPTSRLSIAERQLVEIARALSMQVKLLILDEPTSSLTLDETERLLKLIADLKAEGVAILYISHRLDEVIRVSDRVVALRDGKNVGELNKSEISHDAMVQMMVGRSLAESVVYQAPTKTGEPRLTLQGVRTLRYPDSPIDLEVRSGEILGMAGLVGAGRSELARAIFGVEKLKGGEVIVENKPLRLRSPQDAIRAGVYLIPEDRRGAGLTVEMSIGENISMPNLKQFSFFGLLTGNKETAFTQEWSDKLTVKAPSVATRASNLSGGNQQKVVIARWLSLNPKVLIFDEPTRGIDVGAKAEIYARMRELSASGIAIWMISSDMEEILKISDRVAILHEGKLTGILDRAEATEQTIMQHMVNKG